MIPSYSSIYNIGHRAIAELLLGDVIVEEKLDGSQFSFGVVNGTLECRSKGAVIHIDAPEKMFAKGVETAVRLAPLLTPNLIYRGEYLAKPKHNTLAYEKIPPQHFIVFDIEDGNGGFLSYEEKRDEAERLGLWVAPLLFTGRIEDAQQFRGFLETISILGGQKIEGVVVKPVSYNLFGPDQKVLMGKFVSEAFKEVHGGEWRKANPTSGDILQQLIARYKTPARWAKGVQHLREAGILTDSPKDIGALIKEVQADVRKEEETAIRDALWSFAWPHISRGVVAGIAEWYKEELVKAAFERGEDG